jgi:hypothetical protein
MRSLFPVLALLTITFNTYAQSTCPEFAASSNIYAGLEIGSRGMKPTIVRFEEAENGKTSFITMSKDLMPMNTNPAKAKTKADIDCTVDRVVRYVNVFRNDPYNVPDSRITLIMSSGLKGKLIENGRDSLLHYLKDKVKRQTGLTLLELSEKEEGEDKVNHLAVDEEYPYQQVHVFDIGSGNITGGYCDKKAGQSVASFATDGSINSIANFVKDAIQKNNWVLTNPYDRAKIAQLASQHYTEKHLSQMQFGANPTNVVCGGGTAFTMMTWFKAESFGDKRLNNFFPAYVNDYYNTLIDSKDKEEFFKENRAKDNSPLTWKGKARLADAKPIFNDLELLVGAAILKTICDDLAKKGTKNFYFDDQMLNSGLRYYLYKKYKGMATAQN